MEGLQEHPFRRTLMDVACVSKTMIIGIEDAIAVRAMVTADERTKK